MKQWLHEQKLLPPWVSFLLPALGFAATYGLWLMPMVAFPALLLGVACFLRERRAGTSEVIRCDVPRVVAPRALVTDFLTRGWILEEAGDEFLMLRRGRGVLLIKHLAGASRLVGPRALVEDARAALRPARHSGSILEIPA